MAEGANDGSAAAGKRETGLSEILRMMMKKDAMLVLAIASVAPDDCCRRPEVHRTAASMEHEAPQSHAEHSCPQIQWLPSPAAHGTDRSGTRMSSARGGGRTCLKTADTAVRMEVFDFNI